ncbi:hypothetical protein MANES_17G035505v8 [Manihot esculenta]|uniref:Uncharacterized protein n=1 Tax=Manihot esculenta TaxID=3983 RepID=A0ACB7G2F0_MANES|nr:hypothetical protein MANES_17G035505v8 [Manihot esculenta]
MAESEYSFSDVIYVNSQGILFLVLFLLFVPCLSSYLFQLLLCIKKIESFSTYADFELFGSELRNQESKLEFSEDEEELLIRMFNLVGKSFEIISWRNRS